MKSKLHSEICNELNVTYIKKNHDYGDSFAKLREEYNDSILVRLFDKYCRLKTLIQGESIQVEDESIDDTLSDLANYCIMELVERRIERSYTKPDRPEPSCERQTYHTIYD